MMELVSWDDDIPNIWKVIKLHGSIIDYDTPWNIPLKTPWNIPWNIPSIIYVPVTTNQ